MWTVRGPDPRRNRTYRVLENALEAHLKYPGSSIDSAASWPEHELRALFLLGRKRKARQARISGVSAQTALSFQAPNEDVSPGNNYPSVEDLGLERG